MLKLKYEKQKTIFLIFSSNNTKRKKNFHLPYPQNKCMDVREQTTHTILLHVSFFLPSFFYTSLSHYIYYTLQKSLSFFFSSSLKSSPVFTFISLTVTVSVCSSLSLPLYIFFSNNILLHTHKKGKTDLTCLQTFFFFTSFHFHSRYVNNAAFITSVYIHPYLQLIQNHLHKLQIG